MTIFGGILEYLGLIGALAGVVSVLKPLRLLGIRTRKSGLLVVGLGLLTFLAGTYLPVSETRVTTARTRLDEFVPVFQFGEFHSIQINAPKDRVDAAIRTVTPDEIRFFQTLTWIRRFGRPASGILNAPGRRPILDTFASGWFHVLADEPGREIVVGTGVVKDRPPHPRPAIAMNFRIEEVDAAHCTLTTETRVYVTGFHVLHGFAGYWRMIYPGSSLIRYEWLRAIQRRAEEATDTSIPGV